MPTAKIAVPSLPRGAGLTLAALCVTMLSACGGISLRADNTPATPTRTIIAAPTEAASAKPADPAAEGLKLARLLRDQNRFDAASELYAQLEQRGDLKPLQLLEYATVAARVQAPQDSLALFGRARSALRDANVTLTPEAQATLCNGLGRARAAQGQSDAALADFDCTLAAMPNDVTALNAKGVLLDARGAHVEARELLKRASEQAPADLRLLNNLALSHLASGDIPQATRLLTQATQDKRHPLWPTLQLNLAFAYTLQNDDARASQTLDAFMAPQQAQQTLSDFAERRQRIRDGASVAEELLAASRRLQPLRSAKASHG